MLASRSNIMQIVFEAKPPRVETPAASFSLDVLMSSSVMTCILVGMPIRNLSLFTLSLTAGKMAKLNTAAPDPYIEIGVRAKPEDLRLGVDQTAINVMSVLLVINRP